MNLLEILATAEKIEQASERYCDHSVATICAVNYMLKSCTYALKAEKEDNSVYVGYDLFTPTASVIKISSLAISNLNMDCIEEYDYNKLLFDPLKKLAVMLSERFPEEKLNPNYLDHLKYKRTGVSLGKTKMSDNMDGVNPEIGRLSELLMHSNNAFRDMRNEFTDYLDDLMIKTAKANIAALMTKDELNLFGKLVQVPTEETHDNETAPRDDD